MANTIRAAKNTFLGGLVMDLAPDTTPNEVLTSALNATLVTFNGNEMLLQNDMGNGRVETARLPEGYIPVGTCEFGDIIYIVSYNPLTNKSLIGCFPSPERNISSEEIGSTGLTLSSADFQVLNNGNPTGELKTSSVKKIIYNNKLNPGDKFVIYDKNKQILSERHITDIGNTSHIYGTFPKWVKIHVIAIEDGGKINYLDSSLRWYDDNYFIRESKSQGGKVDLDAYRNMLSSGYSVFQSKISGKLALLIELEKITGFSCTYGVFGKNNNRVNDILYRDYDIYWNFSWDTDDPNINPAYVCLTKSSWSGKDSSKAGKWYYWGNNTHGDDGLELHQGPSISYDVTLDISINSNIDTGNYSAFIGGGSYETLLTSFLNNMANVYNNEPLTKLNIVREPNGHPLVGNYYINATYYDNNTRIAYTQRNSNGKLTQISQFTIDDVLVNNYFHYPIYKKFGTFTIPTIQYYTLNDIEVELKPDTTNLIYNYEITPAMPYGYLREYSIEGYIDFSKIGTGAIDLTAWKYFVGENAVNLTIGMDAYLEENMGIDEIVLEFYDNQGMAAAYHISDKEYYSGQFTEVIPLNGSTSSYKMLNIDSEGRRRRHCGEISESALDENVVYFDNSGNPVLLEGNRSNDTIYYLDDCGILYSNMLYLVKIIIKYCPRNALGELDTSQVEDFKTMYRWLWTNGMFNSQYYSVVDFKDIPLELCLDVSAKYETTDDYFYKTFKYQSKENSTLSGSDQLYKYLSSTVLVVTNSGEVHEIDPNNPEGSGDSGGGGNDGGGSSNNPEEELQPSEIVVSLDINNGYFRSITVNMQRTIHRVTKSLITVRKLSPVLEDLRNYTLTWNEGATSFTIDIGDDFPASSVIEVSGAAGAVIYGHEQASPAFSTIGQS